MTRVPPTAPPPAGQPPALAVGRCHICGYRLEGLPPYGRCPECGTPYTPETAARLKPWPGAFAICCRLGWPIAGLMLAGLAGTANPALGLVVAYPMVVAVLLNSYFQVRSMLRRSLPEQVRTRGPVFTLRAIGTFLCVVLLLVFVGAPLAVGVTCLVMLSGEL